MCAIINLSILILTHKRPILFNECIVQLLSILNKSNLNIEVLVNNDSNDIIEIKDNRITYFYNTSSVNKLYPFLFNKAKGEYILFLEDDDLLLDISVILNNLYKYDLHIGMYISYLSDRFIYQIKEFKKNKQVGLENSRFKYFQLSQIIFKKKLLTKFPSNFHIENDEKVFNNIKEKFPTYKFHSKNFFKQRVDYQNLSLRTIICDI
jgi:hypothetical protein